MLITYRSIGDVSFLCVWRAELLFISNIYFSVFALILSMATAYCSLGLFCGLIIFIISNLLCVSS